MKNLDLLRIRNNIIGDELHRGISGDERKRVNVAMELVMNPSLLALDEPTTGLDSTTSSELCEILKRLSLTGVNVIACIHQPKIEILEKLTNVLLLGKTL
jgi:ABC-type multidrug transport system ATPase subunit